MASAHTDPMIRIRHPDRVFIDGEWIKPSTTAKLELISPNSEECFMLVAEGREADIDRAVAAARRAFDHGPWPHLSHDERAVKIRALASKLRGRLDELARTLRQEFAAYQAQSCFRHAVIAEDLHRRRFNRIRTWPSLRRLCSYCLDVPSRRRDLDRCAFRAGANLGQHRSGD